MGSGQYPAEIEIWQDDLIGRIRLRRPEKLNALTDDMIQGIAQGLRELTAKRSVRVVLITAEGKHFCAGRDIASFAALQSSANPEDQRKEYLLFKELINAMTGCPVPVVAAIHGYALGAGTGLATWCDIALAGRDAKFGYTEIQLGMIPSLVSVAAARTVVPWKAAVELLLTGRIIDADEAARIGIITRVVDGDVEQAGLDLATQVAALSPNAVRMTKQMLRTLADLTEEQGLEYTIQLAAATANDPDTREGIAAFLEKRKPRWQSD